MTEDEDEEDDDGDYEETDRSQETAVEEQDNRQPKAPQFNNAVSFDCSLSNSLVVAHLEKKYS